MNAQRGHGKRSSFYSDYTFGAWRGDELVPVGKAYSGFTDEELRRLNQWVRNNTVQRSGAGARGEPPDRRSKSPSTASIARPATNQVSAMRFPRIHRIRWDKPFREADTLATLERLLT